MAGWFLPIRTPPRHRAAARRTLFLREWHPLNHTPPQPERMDSSHPALALARTAVGKRSLMKISVGAVHLLPDRRLLECVEDEHAERRQRTSRANPRCRSQSEELTVETDIPARLDRLPWGRFHTPDERLEAALRCAWDVSQTMVSGGLRPVVAAMRHHRLAKERKRADGARCCRGDPRDYPPFRTRR